VITAHRHDGVTEWQCSSWSSRLAGYRASAFLTDDGVLIDTGIPAVAGEFAAQVARAPITGVMITHHHEDHAGNVELLARQGVPIWMAEATVPLVTEVERVRAYRRCTWHSMAPLRAAVTPFMSDRYVAIPTPGHTDDHHAIWDARTRTIFTGDLFLGVGVLIAHHQEDPWAMLASLERIIALQPARLFDAHRGLVPDPVGALQAKVRWMRRQMATIRDALRLGRSDAAIVKQLMGGESFTGWASGGEYARINFVRNVRDGLARGAMIPDVGATACGA
jgi:endoribonuclease LACTB2